MVNSDGQDGQRWQAAASEATFQCAAVTCLYIDYSIVKVSGLGFGLESNFAKFVHNSIKKSKFDSKSHKLDC